MEVDRDSQLGARIEAEAAVVRRTAFEHDQWFRSCIGALENGPDEGTPHAAVLMGRRDCERGEGRNLMGPCAVDQHRVADHDVADHFTIDLRNQREVWQVSVSTPDGLDKSGVRL